MDPLTLTAQLNALLQAIHLPFVLESPADLTPSLLIAILESILNVRIPIAHAIDEDDKNHGRITPPQNRHIQIIKVFLGVLETDILQTDIGLSKLDPRLLAAGAWDEVVYVGEVLCWIGEELGLIQPAPIIVDEGKRRAQDQHDEDKERSASPVSPSGPKAPTPSPSSIITFLPPFAEVSPPPTPTTTTLLFTTDLEDHTLQTNITSPLVIPSPLRQLPNPSTKSPLSPRKPSNPKPRTHTRSKSTYVSSLSTTSKPYVHSHRRSSSLLSASVQDIPRDDSSFSRQSPPIRRTGYISLVDHEAELSSFLEHSLSISSSSPSASPSSTSHAVQRRSQRKHRPKARSHQIPLETLAIPASSETPLTPNSTPRRSSDDKDWRTLLSTSPDHDPRRTYKLLQQRNQLMEELLRIRMSQRRSFR